MNGMFQHVLGVVLLCSYALASTDSIYYHEASESLNSEDARLFLFNHWYNNELILTYTATTLLFTAGILLLGIGTAIALFFLLSTPEEAGYAQSGYQDPGSSYSGYDEHGRSKSWKFNPYGIDWSSLNIIDWISMGQEAYEKFDPANLECQKRMICEIHQNKSKFGGPANTMVELLGYLHYAEILSLPDELKLLLEEYMDASEKGKTMQKDCGEVYEACEFSVNRILSKFSTNEI